QKHYEDTIQYLLDNNAPLDGIGMQGHFSSSPTAIPRIFEIVERFHQQFPDLAIRTTEFDVDTLDEQLQADYTRDFMTMFFSHPATVGIQKWGFWAGAHWRPSAAMYTLDWQEKPNALVWKELIFNTWWNDFTGATDSNGEFSARGFYGTYEVTVNHNETAVSCLFELTPEASAFIVPMDASLLTDGMCQQ
ncbi:MAG TPA: endo-1,4-beta-xylanase, partial [Cellvibrionaceae bacterium]